MDDPESVKVLMLYQCHAHLRDSDSDSERFFTINFSETYQFHRNETLFLRYALLSTRKLEFRIPTAFLASEETCRASLERVLSERGVEEWIKENLVESMAVDYMDMSIGAGGGGFSIEADVEIVELRCMKAAGFEEFDVVDEGVVKETRCAICLEELNNGDGCLKIPCSHVFHRDCVLPWLQDKFSCPLCRSCPLCCSNDSKRGI